MTPIGIQLTLGGEREVETGLRRVGGAMDTVGGAADSLKRAVGGLAGAFAGAISVREFVQAADAVTSLQNQLKLATGGAQQAATAYGALYDIAQRSRTGFVELGTTFASISTAAADLGVSQQRLLTVTEAIGNAVTISGTGAQAAQAALMQLGQGLASGTLRGEELNSVMEQTPRLAKALADGLGVTRGELRALGAQGVITADQVIKALESQASVLSGEVKNATLTVGQAFTQLQNAATRAVGDFDKAAGVTSTLASAMSGLAIAIGTVGEAVRGNETAFKVIAGGVAGAGASAAILGTVAALGKVGGALTAIGAVLAANPAVLALLGIGAAVGGGVAVMNAYSKTADGLQRSIKGLNAEISRLEGDRAFAGSIGQSARVANIDLGIAERRKQIEQLNLELSSINAGPNGTGGGRGVVNPQTVGAGLAAAQADEKRLADIRRELSGVSKDYLPTLMELNKQYEAGRIPLAEYQRLVAELATNNYKKDSSSASGLKEEQNAYESLITSINVKIAQERAELDGTGRLAESDKIRIKLNEELRSGKLKLNAAHLAAVNASIEELALAERRQKAAATQRVYDEQRLQIQQELNDAYLAESRAREAASAKVTEYLAGVMESNDLLEYEISLMGQSERSRETALEQYRIELDLRRRIAEVNDPNSGFNGAGRAVEIARLRSAAAIAKANASSKVFLQEWKESVDQYDDIFRKGFADMLNNGQDGWKSFTKSLVTTFKTSVADQIYKMFLQPFVVQIVGQFMGMTGGGGMLGALGGGGGGVGGAVSGAANLISNGLNVAGMGGAGMQRFADMAFDYGLDAVGEMVDSFRFGMMDTSSWAGFQGAIQQGGARLAGALVGSVMNGFAGYGISRMISGGYQVNSSVDKIGGIASMIPGIGPIAGVISGAINRLFGRKLKDAGLEGEFGGDTGFEGNTYQYYKGGLFRSSKTVRGELDEGLRKGLADQFNTMRLGSAAMAEALGLGTTAIDNFTASIKVSFNGLSEEEIQKALQDEFDKIAESMASLTLGTDEFNRTGETSVEALTRLSSSLVTVNGVLGNLGETLFATSLAGADMASSLLDLFGGASGFNAATGSYFQNFYSPEEQRAAMQQQLEKQLSTLDITLPDINATDARAQYRALAEAQDLTTESGRKTWAMLIQLSESFASVTATAEGLREQIASQRLSLEERLLKARGDDRGALDMRRKQEYDALNKLDPALAQLVSQIYALEDASAIASKRFDIEQRLLIAQGKEREALDLRRGQEYDALYKLDPALANMIAQVWALEDAAQAVADKQAARNDAMRDLSDAMGRQTEIWEGQLAAIDVQRQVQQESLSLITGIFDLVRSNARDLYGEVQSTAAMQASQGNAFIAQALATAKRTGYLPEQDALQQAISAARGGLDGSNFASQVDADFARLVLAGQLKGLEEIAGPQKTAAEQQLERLDAQTESLNKLIREQQKQFDLLQRQIDIENGTYNATLTVAEAMATVIGLLGGKAPAGSGAGAVGNGGAAWGGSAPGATTGSAAAAKYRRMLFLGTAGVGYESITDQSLIDRLDKLASVYHAFDGTGDLAGLGNTFKGAGGTIADLSILSGYWADDWRKAFASVDIAPFANGGTFTNGIVSRPTAFSMSQMGEAGPEAIMPLANVGGRLGVYALGGQGAGGAEVLAELRAMREQGAALREEVAALRAAAEETRTSSGQLADQFDNLTMSGTGAIPVKVSNTPTVRIAETA